VWVYTAPSLGCCTRYTAVWSCVFHLRCGCTQTTPALLVWLCVALLRVVEHCTPLCGSALPTPLLHTAHHCVAGLLSPSVRRGAAHLCVAVPAHSLCGHNHTLSVRPCTTNSLCGCAPHTLCLAVHLTLSVWSHFCVVVRRLSQCGSVAHTLVWWCTAHPSVVLHCPPLFGRVRNTSGCVSHTLCVVVHGPPCVAVTPTPLCMTRVCISVPCARGPSCMFCGVLHINIPINICRNVSNISNAPPCMCLYYT